MSYYKNITHRDYNHFKAKYNNTVPIRGRAEDVRPIGDRKRTAECVTMKKLLSGEVSYCATLYGTDVVEYHNNGQITLRTGGWQTPSTAEFMHERSPFTVWKQDNKLWARVPTPEGVKAYPIGEELTFRMVDGATHGGRYYEPINRVLINKRVVDKAKAKVAREPLQPFLAWCKAFLAMSDGWVMHETRKAALGWEKRENGRGMHMPLFTSSDRELYRTLIEQMEIMPEDTHLRVLCSMAFDVWMDKRQVEVVDYEYTFGPHTRQYSEQFYDYRIEFVNLKRKVYALSEKFGDIYTTVQVEPTDKAIGNTV
jgi:hypothetical protein